MEDNKIKEMKALLYDAEKEEVKRSIVKMNDPEQLYRYAYNYNWDNGFDIPQLILDNNYCELSIALLIFYRADGLNFLVNKGSNENLQQWSAFIKSLYDSILSRAYRKGDIGFKVPLTKVEHYKLKKQITEAENIFIEDIDGKCLDEDF